MLEAPQRLISLNLSYPGRLEDPDQMYDLPHFLWESSCYNLHQMILAAEWGERGLKKRIHQKGQAAELEQGLGFLNQVQIDTLSIASGGLVDNQVTYCPVELMLSYARLYLPKGMPSDEKVMLASDTMNNWASEVSNLFQDLIDYPLGELTNAEAEQYLPNYRKLKCVYRCLLGKIVESSPQSFKTLR